MIKRKRKKEALNRILEKRKVEDRDRRENRQKWRKIARLY